MARTRTLKPEFWDDEKLGEISRDARLTFIGCWTHADDYGVVKGHPLWLKNKIFPYDEINQATFKKWLEELEQIKAMVPFEYHGEKFYLIRNFLKHQTINRPSQQRNPVPPGGLTECSVSTHGAFTDETETETETETENKAVSNETALSPPGDPPPDEDSKIPTCPQKEIIAAYHRICVPAGCPAIQAWDDGAASWLRTRWREDPERQGIGWWERFFHERVATSDFLTGKTEKWRADLRWIVRASNFAKILNSNYVNRGFNTGSKRTDRNLRAASEFLREVGHERTRCETVY